MPVSIKVNTRELERAFKKIAQRMPTVNARALNETGAWAKKNAEKDVSIGLSVPLKLIRKRLNVAGDVKEDRTLVRKANRNRQTVTLDVYVRGIPVGQIAGKPTKSQRRRPGVKGKGGRLYQKAFYAPGAAPHGFVFKRRRSGQLMLPKVGVRRLLNEKFKHYISGRNGTAEFRRRWERLARFELAKIQG